MVVKQRLVVPLARRTEELIGETTTDTGIATFRFHILTLDGSANPQTITPDQPARIIGMIVMLLSEGGKAPADWTPDGKHIVFSGSFSKNVSLNVPPTTLVMDINGKNTVSLFKDSSTTGLFPAWSPDGTRFVFVHVLGKFDGGNVMLGIADADGSNVTDLTDPKTLSTGLATWSPDGTQIAFAGAALPDDTGGIYVVNADGSSQHKIFDFGVVLSISSIEWKDVSTDEFANLPTSAPKGIVKATKTPVPSKTPIPSRTPKPSATPKGG